MKNFIKQTGILSLIIFITFSVWLTSKITIGYYSPDDNPPLSNDLGPINTDSDAQTRWGDLKTSGATNIFKVFSTAIFDSNVGIGVSTPQEKLHLDGGNFLITGGSINSPSASIGNISVTGAGVSANISDNADIGNNLYVGNGLTVGDGGILSNGNVGVQGILKTNGGLIIEKRTDENVSETGRLWIKP